MNVFVIKRSMNIAGRPRDISLEEAFWTSLKAIAADRGLTAAALVNAINSARCHPNLSSAIRLFVIDYYRTRRTVPGARDSDAHTIQRNKQTHTPHMPLISVSFQYCQERAAQARNLAKQMSEPETREALLAIAQQYENLANRAVLLNTRGAKTRTDPMRLLEEHQNERPDLRIPPSTTVQPLSGTPGE